MNGRTRAVLPAVLLASLLVGMLGGIVTTPAIGGDPRIEDADVPGFRNATWYFSTPADYLATDVNLAVGNATLATWPYSQTYDGTNFSAANESSPNVTVGPDLRLTGDPSDRIVNGNFTLNSSWSYAPTGNVTAAYEPERARMGHNSSAANPRTQFDSMEDGASSGRWTATGFGATCGILSDDPIHFEGMESVRCDYSSPGTTNYAGMQRNDGPSWDWSAYDHLAIWISSSVSGLQGYVNLEDQDSINWNTAAHGLSIGWARYVFDVSGPGDESRIDIIQVRFTGLTGTATVYADDLVVFAVFDETAHVSQDFSKPATSGNPGGVLLRFDTAATSRTNLSVELRVEVGSFSWSKANVTTGSYVLDLSAGVTANATYSLRFGLRAARLTEGIASFALSLDNVSLSMPDHVNGTYTAKPFDAGSPALWEDATITANTSGSTSVIFETKSGSTINTSDPTWTPWTPRNGTRIESPPRRYLQWRVHLDTTNGSETPVVTQVTLTYEKYRSPGIVETNSSFLPPDLIGWRRFYASETIPPATAVQYQVSFDGGGSWGTVIDGASLPSLPTNATRVRATLSTSNTSVTPSVAWFRIQYEYLGPLWRIEVSPATWTMTTDEAIMFNATGYDLAGHLVPITCTWSVTSGTGFLRDETATTAVYEPSVAGGPWQVRCTDGSVTGAASVTVLPGLLASISVSPSPGYLSVAESLPFAARGWDAEGNARALTDVRWSTTIGQVSAGPPPATQATLYANASVGSGTLTAREGNVRNDTPVFVLQLNAPKINRTIPNDTRPEDSPTWSLDLRTFADNQTDVNDTLENLRWNIEGLDGTVVTMFGGGVYNSHVLYVAPVRDAVGTDVVTLWLEDKGGARRGQDVSFTMTPLNDPPTWCGFENLPGNMIRIEVMGGLDYKFEFLPYVCDVDNPSSDLSLTTSDPKHIHTIGLNATFSYNASDGGDPRFIEATANDGLASTSTLIEVVVTGNPPPQLIRPLPPVTLNEDTIMPNALGAPLSTFFQDQAGEPLAFVATTSSNLAVSLMDSGATLDIAGKPDFCGTERVTIRATDPEGGFREASMRVTVLCLNDPPVLGWTDDVRVRWDERYVLDVTPFVSDVDNALEGLLLRTNDATNASVDRFAISFLYPWIPLPYTVPLTLTLSDGPTSVSRTITVRVGDNRPPELIEALPLLRFNEDASPNAVDLAVHFEDYEDGDALAFLVQGSMIEPTISAGFLTLTPEPDWFGQEVLLLRATDAQGAFVIGEIHANVLPVNDEPVIRAIPPEDRTGGKPWVVNLRTYVTDVDNALSELTFATDSPNVRAIGPFLLFDFPFADRTLNLKVTASDGQDNASVVMRVVVRGLGIWGAIWWPWSGFSVLAVAASSYVVYTKWIGRRFLFEDLFVVGREGRLVMHTTRRLRPDRDEDLLAGMLTAIVLFVRDSFREEKEELKKFEFGDRKVAVEKGQHVYGAAIFSGEVPSGVYFSLRQFLTDVEDRYGEPLAKWSGDVDDLPGLRGMMDHFGRRGRYRSGDWKRVKG